MYLGSGGVFGDPPNIFVWMGRKTTNIRKYRFSDGPIEKETTRARKIKKLNKIEKVSRNKEESHEKSPMGEVDVL